MAVNGIEIEVGQKWRQRCGGVVEIVSHDSLDNTYPWQDSDEAWYTDGGRYSQSGRESVEDLIELVEHADGFKPWAGGEQPEETRGKPVAYRLQNGESFSRNADLLVWGHFDKNDAANIVAYKVVGEATKPAPAPLHVELIEPEVSAPALLNAAAGHMAARASTYDKPEGERSMAQTVAVFEAHHGIKLTEAQGWHFMQILKDVRLFTRESYHADSAEDCIAYAALKAEALAREGGAK